MDFAPIVLFVYNRPWHTKQVLESLSVNIFADKSDLIVFSDGPKMNASQEELNSIDEVRKIILEKNWCKSVQLFCEERNIGIEESEIKGISKVINEYGKIIVLEDDIVTSKYFLKFMNDGLELYAEYSNIYSINGYMYPIKTTLYNSVLLPIPCAWGWATWKEKWNQFEVEMNKVAFIHQNKFLKERFNIADSQHSNILQLNTWDIRWMYTLFIRNGLGVSPSKSLTINIGLDGSGTHYQSIPYSKQLMTDQEINIIKTNIIDLEFYSKVLDFHAVKKTSVFRVIYSKFVNTFKTKE